MKKLKNPLFLKKIFFIKIKKRAVEFLHPLARIRIHGFDYFFPTYDIITIINPTI